MAGDLESLKAIVHGRLREVEETVFSVKTLQTELGERQKSLEAELHDELLQELSEAVGNTIQDYVLQLHLCPSRACKL